MSDEEFAGDRLALLEQFRQWAADCSSFVELAEKMAGALAGRLAHYSWTGFYMLDPGDPTMLVLGPFVGAPTPHVRIPVTEGICGAAVASGETVIVDDVAADPRYLACSLETRSEIVAPIFAHGRVVGEIDIDSHDAAAFSGEDRIFLEAAARIVGDFMERH